jgi:hypothetical protein
LTNRAGSCLLRFDNGLFRSGSVRQFFLALLAITTQHVIAPVAGNQIQVATEGARGSDLSCATGLSWTSCAISSAMVAFVPDFIKYPLIRGKCSTDAMLAFVAVVADTQPFHQPTRDPCHSF